MNTTTVTDQLYLVFVLENGKNHTVKINDPKANLTNQEVTQASEAMLTKQAIIVGGSVIEDLKDAYEYKVTKERIELA